MSFVKEMFIKRQLEKKDTLEKSHALIDQLELEISRLWAIVKHKSFLLQNNYGLSLERQSLYEQELRQSINEVTHVFEGIRCCFAGECPGENQGFVLHETIPVELPEGQRRTAAYKAPTFKFCHNKLNKKINEIMAYSCTTNSDGTLVKQYQEYPLRYNWDWEYKEDGVWKKVREAQDVAI